MSLDLSRADFRDLPTPALVLDADALERNIARMNAHLEGHSAWARPHTKTHKSPEIARLQLAQSRTVGVCCARVAEAEAMVAGGVEQVLVTSPIVTPEKVRRFASLAGAQSGVWTVVDSSVGVTALEEAARGVGAQIGVVVDLDPGFHRTGIRMGEPAVKLASRVHASPHLILHGVQMYAGTLMHLESASERREKAAALWGEVEEVVTAVRAAGAGCEVITGGGTGTFDIDAAHALPTDLQVGSYVFMDAQYRVIECETKQGEGEDGDDAESWEPTAPFDFFEPSLFVVAAAISQSVPSLITVDAGFKSLSVDHVPEVMGHPGVRYHFAGDEHGMLQLPKSEAPVALGDLVALLVSHCDPTVNLHDHYTVVRGGEVVDTWKVAARGLP